MARSLTPVDACTVMTALVHEALGDKTTVQQVNLSNFASVGEQVLKSGLENTLNSLAIVVGKRYAMVRPREAKLRVINALNSGVYSNRILRDSFYARDPKQSGYFDTDQKQNHAQGYDNGTNSGASAPNMWVQNLPVVMELNFAGKDVWSDSQTLLEDQLAYAFRSASEFGAFVGGILAQKANDIERQKEAFNRAAILQHIAMVYDMADKMPGSVVNLTAEFNEEFGTSYTSEELRTTYLKEFLEFYTAKVKLVSNYMTDDSTLYHWSPAKQVGGIDYILPRNTPKSAQKMLLFSPLFTKAKSYVLPEIFHPDYIDKGNGEMVNYWQNINDPSAIDVVPAIPNVDTPANGQIAGPRVQIPYVVGMLFDSDALMVDYQLERALSTPVEASKGYRNIWYHFAKNIISDPTLQTVIFIMEDT